MTNPGSRELTLKRVESGLGKSTQGAVVVEEPLEIRLRKQSIAITMRTPGHDPELAVGFLVTEGIVEHPDVVLSAVHCAENENQIDILTDADDDRVHMPDARNFYATSSCGVCGKASIEAVRQRTPSLKDDQKTVPTALLATLTKQMRSGQVLFDSTGSLHAAALFNYAGDLLCLREDIGRHNAVDKVIGWAALREQLPLRERILLVSGRVGFEITQKSIVAEIPIIAGVSGSSTLAIELARESSQTLIGFLRGDDFNIYSAESRIV